MINIANANFIRNTDDTFIYVGRRFKKWKASPLGNPYKVNAEDSNRDEVIDKYKKWFYKKIEEKDEKVINEIRKIIKLAREGNVTLVCWCWPNKCHAIVIKDFVEKHI